MSNLTDFFPSGGGGGLTPKFIEYNSSGIFTPSQALIDAGGYIEVFLVGGGERGISAAQGGCGGEVISAMTYLNSTNNCSILIGAGGTSNGADGGDSIFTGSSAGGIDITALGGSGLNTPSGRLTSGSGAYQAVTSSVSARTLSTTVNSPTIVLNNTADIHGYIIRPGYAYQSAYSNASQYASAYGISTPAGMGFKGYGAGGSASSSSGIYNPKINSGSGSTVNVNAASGFCLIKWYE